MFEPHWDTPPNKKIPPMQSISGFLVGCPVGLEPTVSRSTIWRVNRLRYGHHIDAPEGTRTPGPLLRRQLLYPPELRAHVVIPWVPLWRQLCVGTRCEKYNTIHGPILSRQKMQKSFSFFKARKALLYSSHMPAKPKAKPSAAPPTTSRIWCTPVSTRPTQMSTVMPTITQPAFG